MSFLEKAKAFLAEKVAENVKTPEASVTDVDLKRVSLSSVEYLAKITVDNPYGVDIPICDICYLLRSAGREIASGTIPDPGSLKGHDRTLLEVQMKVAHSLLVSLVRDIGADWDIDYELEIGLTIDLPIVGNITLPLEKKGEVKLPTLADVF